jgi:hypothetical protein
MVLQAWQANGAIVTQTDQSTSPASHELRQRRVDLQRRTQVPRACIADVVAIQAAHVHVLALASVVGLPLCH